MRKKGGGGNLRWSLEYTFALLYSIVVQYNHCMIGTCSKCTVPLMLHNLEEVC